MIRRAIRLDRRTAGFVALGLLVAAGLAYEAWRRLTPKSPPWVSKITAATRAKRPNLLLVVYDARRRDDFSFGPFGNARGDTPFLARFKDDAVYFEQAVAPGCWTVPVHAAIFTGLSVCELGNDYYNPGWSALPGGILSLPEILRAAGYHTVAYADHPYFFNSHLNVSLVRGFEQFNVVSDFEVYTSSTNVATPAGRIVQEPRLGTVSREISLPELMAWLRDREGGAAGEPPADWDPVNEVALARLPELFERSGYFERRYGREWGAHVFGPRPRDRPFFLFLNLHMATVALPDPVLYARWVTETLLLNARHRRRRLSAPGPHQDFYAWLDASAAELGLRHAPFPSPALYLKHVFDNRFYDATFEAVFRYLETRGLTGNTVTVVTSDHGMGLREHGESLYVHAGARPQEDLIRVPLVVRYPVGAEGAPRHGRYEEPVSLLDLFPTFVELGLGPGVFERALPVRGQNLAARLRDRRFEPYLVAEAALGPNSYRVAPNTMGYAKAVIAQGMKLIHAPELYRTPPGGAGWPITVRLGEGWPFASPPPPLERLPEPIDLLFDLASDPHERRNLASERPEHMVRLKALVRSWSCQSLPWGPTAPIWQGEARATLRALGYIQ